MKTIQITSSFQVYPSVDALPDDVQKLMQLAHQMREKAYAPYSKFHVGTAILMQNGAIITGNNQENAAYPSGLCAERVAVFQAGAQHPDVPILKMAICAGSLTSITDKPIPPCGACRQSISEYESKQNSSIEIFFMGTKGEVYHSESLENLLPLSFDKTVL